jgi:hypothetical protein
MFATFARPQMYPLTLSCLTKYLNLMVRAAIRKKKKCQIIAHTTSISQGFATSHKY